MEIQILGSGSWEGVPAFGCNCSTCTDAIKNVTSRNNRTRPEILIRDAESGSSLLFECSPDIRLQSSQIPDRVTAIFLTHAHYDHAGGLPELHAYIDITLGTPLKVYCSAAVARQLQTMYAYLPLEYIIVEPYTPIVVGALTVLPIPVAHHYATDSQAADQYTGAVGYIITKADKKVTYLGDFYSLTQQALDAVAGSDVLISDGTYLFEEEYTSEFARCIYDERDQDHLHGQEIIDFASKTSAHTVIYHSISHLPALGHEQMQDRLPVGQFIAYDSMKLAV